MEKIKLISDSTCDLTEELVKELDLEVVPLIVAYENDPETVYHDGIDITQEDIAKHVKETKKLPVTGAVGPAIYEELFNKYIDEGYSIIFTGIGGKLSSNQQSVNLGKSSCKDPSKVTVIDSNNLSSAAGIVLLKIRDFLAMGLSREEVKEKIDTEIVPNIRCSFCIDTCDYLAKGGRCSSITNVVTKVFSIKPIIVVQDGVLSVGKKPIGKIDGACKVMFQDMQKELDICDPEYVMIPGVLNDESKEFTKSLVEKTNHFKRIHVTNAGAVITSHCGPGTVGLIYLVNPKKNATAEKSKKEKVAKEKPKKEEKAKKEPKTKAPKETKKK